MKMAIAMAAFHAVNYTNIITIDKFEIPIGSYYKEAFLQAIGLAL